MTADGTTRTEKFPSGIASVGLGEVERRVPLDEPPPLPPNAALMVIGKPTPRQNGRAKVTGATLFTVDVTLPGMLHGRILRATLPHAEVRAIDISAAARHPGVRAILLVARPDDPAAAVVRYVGAPVAAVAAVSIAAAEEALRLIRVDYRPLPFVVDMDKAREPTASLVYDSASAPEGNASGFPAPSGLPLNGNVRGPTSDSRGGGGFAPIRGVHGRGGQRYRRSSANRPGVTSRSTRRRRSRRSSS
jgi:xanthine dehydrogenase YagR molybdenum-binding subunit